MTWAAVTLIFVLAGLALLHAYWGLGGRWPGHDDISLVERVVGRTKSMRAPPPRACFAVAAALLSAAAVARQSKPCRSDNQRHIHWWNISEAGSWLSSPKPPSAVA